MSRQFNTAGPDSVENRVDTFTHVQSSRTLLPPSQRKYPAIFDDRPNDSPTHHTPCHNVPCRLRVDVHLGRRKHRWFYGGWQALSRFFRLTAAHASMIPLQY